MVTKNNIYVKVLNRFKELIKGNAFTPKDRR